ncbi:MAG: AAA family ATPase, partial [Gammaproteobacteria bacterium]|nr:AAA family ATPase [Gammaproteobacteria bacterium]
LVMADTNVVDDQVIALALEDAPDRINLSAGKNSETEDQWVDLKTHEKRYLSELMEAHQNDKEAVAKILGISTRSLYRKLQD